MRLHPIVKDQVQKDICQQWTDNATGESAERTSPSAALRTGREALASSGSH